MMPTLKLEGGGSCKSNSATAGGGGNTPPGATAGPTETTKTTIMNEVSITSDISYSSFYARYGLGKTKACHKHFHSCLR